MNYERRLPKPVHMGFTLRREDNHENSTEYEWHVNTAMDKVNGGPRYHYLFVIDGATNANAPACPITHPDQAWTASTTQDLGAPLPTI